MTRNTPAWIGIAVLLAAGGYLAAGPELGAAVGAEAAPQPRLSNGIALLIVVAGATLFGYRDDANQALKQTLLWLALALMLVVTYSYRSEFNQVGRTLLAELIPGGLWRSAAAVEQPAGTDQGGAAAITASMGGHFFVEAMINGSHVRLMADTGATLVSLTAEDARRLGFDPTDLDYNYATKTANGVARAAHIKLDEVRVGPIVLNDVHAAVSEEGRLEENLLGMSFLSRLSSFQVRGDQLILEQ